MVECRIALTHVAGHNVNGEQGRGDTLEGRGSSPARDTDYQGFCLFTPNFQRTAQRGSGAFIAFTSHSELRLTGGSLISPPPAEQNCRNRTEYSQKKKLLGYPGGDGQPVRSPPPAGRDTLDHQGHGHAIVASGQCVVYARRKSFQKGAAYLAELHAQRILSAHHVMSSRCPGDFPGLLVNWSM